MRRENASGTDFAPPTQPKSGLRLAAAEAQANRRARRPTPLPSSAMRIDEILAGDGPCFSIEFFPPKTPEGVEQLFATVEALVPLGPDFVSVTYGAAGSTREGTIE